MSGQPGSALVPLVWFGLGQSVIVRLETTKSRLQVEPDQGTRIRPCPCGCVGNTVLLI